MLINFKVLIIGGLPALVGDPESLGDQVSSGQTDQLQVWFL